MLGCVIDLGTRQHAGKAHDGREVLGYLSFPQRGDSEAHERMEARVLAGRVPQVPNRPAVEGRKLTLRWVKLLRERVAQRDDQLSRIGVGIEPRVAQQRARNALQLYKTGPHRMREGRLDLSSACHRQPRSVADLEM